MKNKTLIFTVLTIFVLIVIVVFNAARFNEWNQRITRINQTQLDFCLNEQNITEENKEACELIIEQGVDDIGFYYAFSDIQINTFSNVIFAIPLLIISISLIYPSTYLKNKVILNEMNRTTYNKSMKNMFTKSFIPIIILPIITIIVMIFSYSIESNFNILIDRLPWAIETLSSPFKFILLYLTNVTLYSIIFILIGLIFIRKNQNYFIAVLQSYLSVFIIQIFFELFINGIVFNFIIKSDFGIVFNLLNFVYFPDYYGVLITIFFPIILITVLSVIIYYMYRSREQLIIDIGNN